MRMKLRGNSLRNSQEESFDHGSWAISYGDLVTILLSFFILFFSTDFGKKDKNLIDQSLVESIEGSLFMSEPMSAELKDEAVSIKKIDKDHFLVFFKNTSFFDSGSVNPNKTFDDKMINFVSKIDPFLSKFKLVIHAYTDSTPVSSKSRFHDNVELSGLRAISVKKKLETLGIEGRRMEISGKGILSEEVIKFMGISLDDTEKVKKVQRTVAFVVRRDYMDGADL
mgnify:CR=1 FL=1